VRRARDGKQGVAHVNRTTAIAVGLTLWFGPSLRADNWPQFRGPAAAGVAEGPTLPDKWSATENVVWKATIPGRGWSCPIVWGDRVFVTTAVSEGTTEPVKKGLYFGGDRHKASPAVHRWLVLCLDRSTGDIVWQREAHKGKPATPIHIKNSYASETPVTDGERVYAYFGNVGLFCYDFDGKPVWSKKWDAVPMQYNWGPAASPLLYKDRLYIINDNEKKSYLAALDKLTGDEVWRAERDEKSNWATPAVWENDRRTEIVTPGTGKVRSYGLDGKLLWEFRGMSMITIPTPLSRFGLLYVGSGYVMDKNKPLYAIRPGAAGDISLTPEQNGNEHIAWRVRDAAPYNPSFLIYGDYLYVLYDRGFFSCYDARTGKSVYSKQRIPGGSAFTASPWAYNGKVFCLSEDGVTTVIQAGPEYKVLGQNSLDELTMATPAVAGGSLFLRTDTTLYRIEKK
jgi:outer membrane protein assembly factor BamB